MAKFTALLLAVISLLWVVSGHGPQLVGRPAVLDDSVFRILWSGDAYYREQAQMDLVLSGRQKPATTMVFLEDPHDVDIKRGRRAVGSEGSGDL